MTIRLGLNSEAFLDWPLQKMLDWLAESTPEIVDLEVVVGGYCEKSHCDVDQLLSDKQARHAWREGIERAGLDLRALNVSGNPLSPNQEIAARHDRSLRNAILLAAELGIDRIVAMSGCPGAGPSDRFAPHFAANAWLPDYAGIVDWQWHDRILPYWADLSAFAFDAHPSLLICLELHPGAAAYNVHTFARLAEVGPNIAVNLDPSHFFWQSMDPLAIIRHLSTRIGHAHAKDTVLLQHNLALNGLLDNRWPGEPLEMPWNFATVGRGHEVAWWQEFVEALDESGFDGTLAIEHEDPLVPAEQGVVESARVLHDAIRHARIAVQERV
jgi:sugar phosphate isomerase/epimerase